MTQLSLDHFQTPKEESSDEMLFETKTSYHQNKSNKNRVLQPEIVFPFYRVKVATNKELPQTDDN